MSSLTTVAAFRHLHAAHIARAQLEAEGIPVFLAGEHIAFGAVRLQVPAPFAEEARRLMDEDHSRSVRQARRSLPHHACPACGALAPRRQTMATRAPAGRAAFTLWENRFSCGHCQHSW